jgi:hypothetical protein
MFYVKFADEGDNLVNNPSIYNVEGDNPVNNPSIYNVEGDNRLFYDLILQHMHPITILSSFGKKYLVVFI